MKVGMKILLMSLMLVFCSAFMSNSLFISSAYALEDDTQNANIGTTTKGQETVQPTPASNSGSNITGSGWNVGAKTGGTYATSSCERYSKEPFKLIACKAATTLEDLRIIVYMIAGFGLIAFAFSAIFGKISFKHLSQIAIGLFLVSMTAPFIEYFVGSSGDKLVYGDYLTVGDFTKDKLYFGAKNDVTKSDCGQSSRGYNNNSYYYAECKEETVTSDLESDPLAANSIKDQTSGSGSTGSGSASTGSSSTGSGSTGSTSTGEKTTAQDGNPKLADLASDTATDEEKEATKKSLKDSVKDIISVVKAGSNAVGAAKQTIKDVGYQTSNVIDAVKNGEGGLSGLIDAANVTANAGKAITDSTYRLSRNLESNISTVADGVQDLNSSNEQRAANKTARASGQATNTVSGTVQGQTVGNAIGSLDNARNTASQNQQTVGGASNDANSMSNIFGGVDSAMGQVVGIGIFTGSTVGGLTETGTDASATAAARAASSIRAASDSGVYAESTDKNGNRKLVYRDGTVQEVYTDGSQKVTYSDGGVVSYDKNGKVVKSTPGSVKSVEFSNGKMIYKDANGNVVGEAGYNQNVVPSGAVRADVNSDGSLVFYDANNNKVTN